MLALFHRQRGHSLRFMPQADWAETTSRRVAAEIKQLRGERSAQWLSDRTAELGHRVTRSRISDIETGRRTRIDITEVLILAAALDVPPLLLLFPGVPNEPSEPLPGRRSLTWWAAQWFAGEKPLTWLDDDGTVRGDDEQAFGLGAAPLLLLRLWEDAHQRNPEALRDTPGGESAATRQDLEAAAAARRHLRQVEALMKAHGVEAPRFTPGAPGR